MDSITQERIAIAMAENPGNTSQLTLERINEIRAKYRFPQFAFLVHPRGGDIDEKNFKNCGYHFCGNYCAGNNQ